LHSPEREDGMTYFDVPAVDKSHIDICNNVEWSPVPNKPVKEALETIRKEVKIDRESLIACFSA
jgi:hypothetical protein